MKSRCIVPFVFTSLLLLHSAALAQDTESMPLPEMTPEYFPSVTPLPARSPSALPVPEEQPSTVPTVTPSYVPTPVQVRPTPIPLGKGVPKIKFDLAEAIEGQSTPLTLRAVGAVRQFPVKGHVVFEDMDYQGQNKLTQKIPFVLKGTQPQSLTLRFHTPGKKTVRIETANPELPTRNVLVYVKPFTAGVFPREINRNWSKQARDWQVLVNLHYDNRPGSAQRQYYEIIHKGELVQRLLTSSATADRLTPTGNFKLGVKAASPKSTLYESVMPFWTTIMVPGYSYEYGNHGLTGESYMYYLGAPASHGCLRLSNKWVKDNGEWLNIGGARWVYEHVPVGTPIHIYRQARQPFAFENYQMWVSQKR